jgi:hypothetical protein
LGFSNQIALIVSGRRWLVNDRSSEAFKGFGPIRTRELTEQFLRGMKAMKLLDQYEVACKVQRQTSRLIDEPVLNSVLVLVVVTSVLGPSCLVPFAPCGKRTPCAAVAGFRVRFGDGRSDSSTERASER